MFSVDDLGPHTMTGAVTAMAATGDYIVAVNIGGTHVGILHTPTGASVRITGPGGGSLDRGAAPAGSLVALFQGGFAAHTVDPVAATLTPHTPGLATAHSGGIPVPTIGSVGYLVGDFFTAPREVNLTSMVAMSLGTVRPERPVTGIICPTGAAVWAFLPGAGATDAPSRYDLSAASWSNPTPTLAGTTISGAPMTYNGKLYRPRTNTTASEIDPAAFTVTPVACPQFYAAFQHPVLGTCLGIGTPGSSTSFAEFTPGSATPIDGDSVTGQSSAACMGNDGCLYTATSDGNWYRVRPDLPPLARGYRGIGLVRGSRG